MKHHVPQIRGRYTENADLSKTNWFRVGGPAEVLFKPADLDDLIFFLKNKPAAVPITILGVGSNIIIRDGGVKGVVIKLGREFASINLVPWPQCQSASMALPSRLALGTAFKAIEVGAAALDVNAAIFAAENNVAGLEFLVGIPGGIGGGVAMNAGAYDKEIKDVLISAELVDLHGEVHKFSNAELQFTYRKSAKLLERQFIVTKAVLRGEEGSASQIYARMGEIKEQREASQPIRSRTGGSTFKNPPGHKAWELIDQAGCRSLTIGGAQVSEKHCNFFINTGTASAADLENLITAVKKRVLEKSGVELESEIKIIGDN